MHGSRLTFVALFPLALLAGCLDHPSDGGGSEEASLEIRIDGNALAARAASPDVGGRLVVAVSNPARGLTFTDSSTWSGGTASFSFPSLPEGAGWQVVARYNSPAGFVTHKDSLGGIALVRGTSTPVALLLAPTLGKILVSAPSVPTGCDTLGLVWEAGVARRTVAPRGSGGRTTLRLDSLPVGVEGTLRVRAWNTAGDTLFVLDTLLTLPDDQDLSLALSLLSATGSTQIAAAFLPGGEANLEISFAGEVDQSSSQGGDLVIAALSDSGSSDWIAVANAGTSSVTGTFLLGKGTGDMELPLSLEPGERLVATRAACTEVARLDHPLHSEAHVACGQELAVVTHSTSGGNLWRLRTGSGQLLDQVLVLDAKLSWPDLNTSTARTARVRPAFRSPLGNDAGRAWCADGSDSPSAECAP